MKKTIKRILAMALLVIAVAISGLATIILVPQPLFAKKLEHKQFTVYSNEEISPNIVTILDNALQLVEKSELNDHDYRYDIFFAYNSFFNRVDNTVLGFGPSARATDNNITIKVRVDIRNDSFFPTFHKHCQGRLTYLITHEMIHCLQANKYGILRFNPLQHPELWKLEGYPEYISRQAKRNSKEYSLIKEIDRYVYLDNQSKDIWISIEEGRCEAPKYYYKGRLMIEYLMSVKHWSYDQILNDNTPEEEVYADMLNWRNRNKHLEN